MKCPKCRNTKIDDQFELIDLGYGEIDCIDWDPICEKCEHPLGDEWYEEKKDDFISIYQSAHKSFSRRISAKSASPRRKSGKRSEKK